MFTLLSLCVYLPTHLRDGLSQVRIPHPTAEKVALFYLYLFIFLAAHTAHGILVPQTPCSGSTESQPLDLQGSPEVAVF